MTSRAADRDRASGGGGRRGEKGRGEVGERELSS